MKGIINIQFHGTPQSKYDAIVRGYASEYNGSDCSLESFKYNLEGDIRKISRVNASVASNAYVVKMIDQFEMTERVEIWNEVIPNKERKIATITRS